MSNIDLVRRFIDAWEARSIDAILAMMSPTAVYRNSGYPDAVGHEQIRTMISAFLVQSNHVRFEVIHIAETADGSVLTERTDIFQLPDRLLTLPVMGVFEFDGDLISGWRDYFDPSSLKATS